VSNPQNGKYELCVLLDPFVDRSIDAVMDYLTIAAPDVKHLEVGVGGYNPNPHLDPELLLSDAGERQKWLDNVTQRGFNIAALNLCSNVLHPDREIASAHDRQLRNAIRLATEMGVDRIVTMAGCPGAVPGDLSASIAVGGWLPYLEGVYDRQWTEVIEPYWSSMADFAKSVNPDLRICFELHPGSCVFNVDTFERVAELGPSIAANLDPSHFMWMGMDGHKVASRIADRVGHIHGKDLVFHPESLALNGLLDCRWPIDPEDTPWTFTVPGRGHDLAWWTELFNCLRGSQARVVSIEHEDPFVQTEKGIPEAASLLKAAIEMSDKAMAR
jgi:sugar phosphate isomerase/epimerase